MYLDKRNIVRHIKLCKPDQGFMLLSKMNDKPNLAKLSYFLVIIAYTTVSNICRPIRTQYLGMPASADVL